MTPLRRLTVAVAVGVLAGLGGIAVTLVLHGTQHLLFGYESGTFLQGIEAAPAWRRVAGACAGGLVVGLGWAWLRRPGRPTTVSEAIAGSPSASAWSSPASCPSQRDSPA